MSTQLPSTDTDQGDVLNMVRSKHLQPPLIKPLAPAEDDEYAPCRTALHDAKTGKFLRDKSGRIRCRCRCISPQGFHRKLHESCGTGFCLWCDTPLSS